MVTDCHQLQLQLQCCTCSCCLFQFYLLGQFNVYFNMLPLLNDNVADLCPLTSYQFPVSTVPSSSVLLPCLSPSPVVCLSIVVFVVGSTADRFVCWRVDISDICNIYGSLQFCRPCAPRWRPQFAAASRLGTVE